MLTGLCYLHSPVSLYPLFMGNYPVDGAGVGIRRGMFRDLARHDQLLVDSVDFVEFAPENWIGVGGKCTSQFASYVDRFPVVCHGLSLSLGGLAPLNIPFLKQVRNFLGEINAKSYTEHLSACGDEGQLYDLMPIPFTSEAVRYVADRIKVTQDVLERRIAVEHVSYYAAPLQEMEEIDFINAVIAEADCNLLLDVNNIYVNSINFGYDPNEFLDALPSDRIEYVHIAGHYVEAPDIRIDTHGADVIDPVWRILDRAFANFGPMPTLLERDSNFPPAPHLLQEVKRIKSAQHSH